MIKLHRQWIFPFLLLFLLGMVFSLSACRESVGETAIRGSSSPVVYGASQFANASDTYQVCESGILYLSSNLAQYYDFEAEQSYVLCNRANCRHNDTSCPAYAKGSDAMTGLAYFQDAVYLVRRNDDAGEYELLRLNLTSDTQEVVAALEIGSYENGEWVLERIGNVAYAGNHVWMEATYGYVSVDETGHGGIETETVVLTGIDITTGEITRLNEVTDGNDSIGCKAVSEDYVVFERLWYDEPMLSESEFYEAAKRGEYAQDIDLDKYIEESLKIYENEEDAYANAYENAYSEAYYNYRNEYQAAVPKQYADMIYEVSTGALTEFDSGECFKELDEDGIVTGEWAPYIFEGIDGDTLLYGSMYEYIYEDSDTQYAYSFSNGTREALFTYPTGGAFYCFADEHVALCRDYRREENQALFFYYDLETGERTDLFLDDINTTFQMIGYTQDRYLGLIYNDPVMSLDVFDGAYFGTLHQISKKDFESGNLDAAEKISLGIFN